MLRELLNKRLKYKILEILFVFLAGAAIILILKPIFKDDPFMSVGVVWISNAVMFSMVWAGIKIRGEKWEDFGLAFKHGSLKGILKTILWSLFVLGLALFGFAIASSVMASILDTTGNAAITGFKYLKGDTTLFIWNIVGVLIMSSFAEEIIYRAFLVNRVIQLGVDQQLVKPAIIISALFFGLAHFDWGVMGIIQTFAIGIVFSICYLKLSKRLWVIILTHGFLDIILMTKMYLG